jgi:G3E family GTPase
VGCSLASSLVDLKKDIKKTHDPDVLFVEPSEMVVTEELRQVAAMGRRDIRYEIGPFITLVDGPLFGFLWQERRKLLLGQVSDADLVVISRCDQIDRQEIQQIKDLLAEYHNGIDGLSVHQNLGLDAIWANIADPT